MRMHKIVYYTDFKLIRHFIFIIKKNTVPRKESNFFGNRVLLGIFARGKCMKTSMTFVRKVRWTADDAWNDRSVDQFAFIFYILLSCLQRVRFLWCQRLVHGALPLDDSQIGILKCFKRPWLWALLELG